MLGAEGKVPDWCPGRCPGRRRIASMEANCSANVVAMVKSGLRLQHG